MSRSFPLLLVGTLALAACTTPPNLAGQTGPEHNNRNAGAAIGAVAGGLLAGPVADGNNRETAAGVVVGAAVGGLIGAQLDRQAAELRRDLGNGITVENQGDQLLVSFPQDILFATDSATIGSASRGDLRDLATNLQRYPDTTVEVIGHTDNTGSAAHNMDLSVRRAGAVSALLVQDGVSGARITTTGRGEDQPIATNLTPEGRALNRRVAVVIRPTAT